MLQMSYDSVTVSEVTRVVIHLHECSLTHLSQNMQMYHVRRLSSGVKLQCVYCMQRTSINASFP